MSTDHGNKLQVFSSALNRRKEDLRICEERCSTQNEYNPSEPHKEKNMSRKVYMILSVLLVVAFALTSCSTPATEAPTEAPARAGGDTGAGPTGGHTSAGPESNHQLVAHLDQGPGPDVLAEDGH